MSRKRHILYIVIAIIALTAIYLIVHNMPEKSPRLNEFEKNIQNVNPQQSDKKKVHLYFADKGNSFLIAEERIIAQSPDPAEFGKTIIEALIKGPIEGLMRTIPVGTALSAFYITQDGTAYVDLTKEVKERHPGGIKTELITIYSIVNSLTLNISGINAVKILIGGYESMTLSGHIDLRFPLKANMLLIR
ncbi:MAG: GerMN domain-containing protein [Desulfobacteraceae bacterium]|nr:GerMN domain-containing protein [Desulfobacteraceae bacterium]MBC2719900.1 GerMN domain-containing protein [Desulfobacteraceae bacterium]